MAGILDTLAKTNAAKTTGRQAPAAQDRPQAQTWMNIGYSVQLPSGETKFINLPLGLPIDTMELAKVPRNADEYAQIQTARNELLKELQALGDKLEPGEAKTVFLEVQIRRVNDEVEVDAETNVFSLANAGLKLVE